MSATTTTTTTTPAVAKWEYKVLVLTGTPTVQSDMLNLLGAEGWELCQVTPPSWACMRRVLATTP